VEAHATPYRYDAFVLYSSVDDDRQWVHLKLVPDLEDVYGFRLCIHHRDFLGGCDIMNTIDRAIRSSRKVIVVMSENFLKSDWCVEEFSMTAAIARRKLVVVMYKDVMLANVHIPPVVRQSLESTTYIEWHEHKEAQQLFWKRLRRALHSKQQPTPSRQSRDQQLQQQSLDQGLLLLSDIETGAGP
jgi:toll-like receptor 13